MDEYQEYLDKVDIQEVLRDAGYHFYRRDGLRYPAYVGLDSDGRRISGDKFIVTANGRCCFHPPEYKRWNVISFIKDHPQLFQDYREGMKPDYLVHLVCKRLLNQPQDVRNEHIIEPKKEGKPFNIYDYDVTFYNGYDRQTQALFDKFFANRGIDHNTQNAFQKDFLIAKKEYEEGKTVTNLAFPLHSNDSKDIRGLEVRGFPKKDGKSFKGMASGTDATHAVWIGNPGQVDKQQTRHIYWFESAYDAMAYYQLHAKSNPEVRKSLFVSTSGNPSIGQMTDMIKDCPKAVHHICFDNDLAGRQFHANFLDVADKNHFLLKDKAEIPDRMKAYIASLDSPQDLYKPTKANIHLLPKEIRSFYKDKVAASEIRLKHLVRVYGDDYDKMSESEREEINMAQTSYNRDASRLEQMIDKELALAKGLQILDARREIPREGYKDWNDQLQGKPSLKVDRQIGLRDAEGRQVVVECAIPPSMLRYMDSLTDKKDVFSGNKHLLPDKENDKDFKEKVLSLLGIKGMGITPTPPEQINFPKLNEGKEEQQSVSMHI